MLPTEFHHIVISGTLPGGEVWAAGWWNLEAEHAGGWDQASWDARVDQLRTAMETPNGGQQSLNQAVRALMSASTKWTTVTAYLYEGTLLNASFVGQSAVTAALQAGQGTVVHPHQTAACISWTAGAGASRRGRTYLPCNGAVLTADGHISSGLVDGIPQGMQSFYTSLAVPAIVPVVVSRKLQAANTCSELHFNDVPDVIRRRVDHLPVAHSASLALPAA